MYNGKTRVHNASTIRVYNPQGSTPIRRILQTVHKIANHIAGAQRLAIAENLAFAVLLSYREATSSSVTKPFSTPHLTHTCARGPMP